MLSSPVVLHLHDGPVDPPPPPPLHVRAPPPAATAGDNAIHLYVQTVQSVLPTSRRPIDDWLRFAKACLLEQRRVGRLRLGVETQGRLLGAGDWGGAGPCMLGI